MNLHVEFYSVLRQTNARTEIWQ